MRLTISNFHVSYKFVFLDVHSTSVHENCFWLFLCVAEKPQVRYALFFMSHTTFMYWSSPMEEVKTSDVFNFCSLY